MFDPAVLSDFLSGVLSGDLPLEDAADDLAALGVVRVVSAASAGFFGFDDGSGFLVSLAAGGSVLVSFQVRDY